MKITIKNDNDIKEIKDYDKIIELIIEKYYNNDFNFINKCIKLKKLKIVSCNIKELPNPNTLNKLKELEIIRCDNIKKIPTTLNKLKKLEIIGCNKIKEIPNNLINLEKLKICYCNKIKEIPNTLNNLKELEIEKCDNIQKIPNNLIKLQKLKIIGYFKKTEIKEIPNNLINLKHLYIDCHNIKEIPNTLINLETLIIYDYGIYIKNIPNNFINLKKLKLSGEENNIQTIPNTFINLKKLIISNLNIKEIPNTFINLNYLKLNDCFDYNNDCKKYFPIMHIKNELKIPYNLINLETLILTERFSGNFIFKLPKTLQKLKKILIETYCNIDKLLYSTKNLKNLKKIDILSQNYFGNIKIPKTTSKQLKINIYKIDHDSYKKSNIKIKCNKNSNLITYNFGDDF